MIREDILALQSLQRVNMRIFYVSLSARKCWCDGF